jgi:hypothetical protein
MTVAGGNEYLKALEKKKIIYPQRKSMVQDIWDDREDSYSGSRYCCESVLWRTEVKRVDEGNLTDIIHRIEHFDDRRVRDFIRGLQCPFSETEEDSQYESYKRIRRNLIIERKRLHKELEKSHNPEKRSQIEDMIRKTDQELRERYSEFDKEIPTCSYSVPPAWYVTYRSGRRDWGIHFVEPLMFLYAKSAFDCLQNRNGVPVTTGGPKLIPRNFIETALYSVLEHEIFHFAFNLFMDKSEKFLDAMGLTSFNQPILYATYNLEVYSKTYFPKGAKEEALASAWEYESLIQSIYSGMLKYELDIDESVKQLRAWKRKSPPGYNGYSSFCSGREVDDLKLKNACISLLRDTLGKCSSSNRRAAQSLQDISSTLHSMLPSKTDLQQIDLPLYVHRER